jgi:hypothetical protein
MRHRKDGSALNKEKLIRIRNYNQGWNGYDANPIPPIVCDRCEELLNLIDFPVEIFPTASESIQFEIEKFGETADGELAQGRYVELNIEKDKVTFYIQDEWDWEREWSVPYNPESVVLALYDKYVWVEELNNIKM